MAHFIFKQEGKAIIFSATYIQEDAERVFGKQLLSKMMKKDWDAYLNETNRMRINEQYRKLFVEKVVNDEHHITISGILLGDVQIIEKVEVLNTCFIASIPSHSNILYFQFGEEERVFRLHKKRTHTAFEY
jgi:hypothetical protein